MSDKVRVGIIGTGQIGKHHIQRYSEIPEVEMVAFCDIRKDEADRVARKYGVRDVYTDYHDLLARDDIDSIDVCLHNFLHTPVTMDALEAGKHVYCEKPMSWTYADALAMYNKAKEAGRMLHIQLGTLFKPETRAAKRLIDEGHLGKIYYARSYTYRRRNRPFVDGYGTKEFVSTNTSGGGTMLDMAVYSMGRMLYLLGMPEVESVNGVTYQETSMYEDRRQISGYNVEELGVGMARLAGGITLLLESSWAIHSGPPVGDSLMGSQGGVRLDPFAYYTTLGDMEMDGTFDLETADWRWRQVDPSAEGYEDSQKHWIWAQLGRVPLMETASFCLRAAKIAEGVYLSAKKGCEVSVAEIETVPARSAR